MTQLACYEAKPTLAELNKNITIIAAQLEAPSKRMLVNAWVICFGTAYCSKCRGWTDSKSNFTHCLHWPRYASVQGKRSRAPKIQEAINVNQ